MTDLSVIFDILGNLENKRLTIMTDLSVIFDILGNQEIERLIITTKSHVGREQKRIRDIVFEGFEPRDGLVRKGREPVPEKTISLILFVFIVQHPSYF